VATLRRQASQHQGIVDRRDRMRTVAHEQIRTCTLRRIDRAGNDADLAIEIACVACGDECATADWRLDDDGDTSECRDDAIALWKRAFVRWRAGWQLRQDEAIRRDSPMQRHMPTRVRNVD